MSCRSIVSCLAIVCLSFVLAACADAPAVTGNTDTSQSIVPNMGPITAGTALPAGYKVDPERTIIFGTDDRWTGRLSYTTSTGADEVFDFLHKEMPNFGWSEVTAMRSDPSLLTFSSSSTARTAIISITRPAKLASTRVDMVVSPTGSGTLR